MAQRLPTSTSTFRDIIQGGYLYIDKTAYIYQLVDQPKGAYFLSRPRRFGKSLFVSTLDELFQGQREFFRGLWIDESDYDWTVYPVIRLDMSRLPSRTAAELENNIKRYLRRIARQYGITLTDEPYYALFEDLIYELSAEKQVVILVDEYDKPLIDHLDNLEEAKKIRDTLKGFYTIVKSMEAHIRLTFITGISKFSKVSIFSELNNLTDLTLNTAFGSALGLTETEIRDNLAEHITAFAQKEGITEEAFLDRMRQWYNGFCFAPDAENVYNPFSTLLLFYHQRFSNYWFESGTPTFLIKLIKEKNYDIQAFGHLEVGELAFSTYELEDLAIVPLLFQTGYLTIKNYVPKARYYTLYYPNYEVENAFLVYLLDSYSELEQGLSETYPGQLITALQNHDLEEFCKILQVLFANIDYDLHLNYEKYYQTIFYLIFTLIGLRTTAEVKTNDGRIDAVIELSNHIYLFEFKLDKSAEEALQQIRDRAYGQKYQLQGKAVTGVGVNFNTQTRMMDGWEAEVF